MIRKKPQSPRTPEQREREKTAREEFQKQRPSLRSIASASSEVVPHGIYHELMRLLKSLKEHRSASGVSLTELAERTGIDKAALSRLESGAQANPTIATLERYAAALGKHIVFKVVD